MPELYECRFYALSDLGLSEPARAAISASGVLTFGDANRTLYTADRVLQAIETELDVDGIPTEDAALLGALGDAYIDLEN